MSIKELMWWEQGANICSLIGATISSNGLTITQSLAQGTVGAGLHMEQHVMSGVVYSRVGGWDGQTVE